MEPVVTQSLSSPQPHSEASVKGSVWTAAARLLWIQMSSWSGISGSPGTMQAILNGFAGTSPCVSQLSCAAVLQRNAHPLPSPRHAVHLPPLGSCSSYLSLLCCLFLSQFVPTPGFLKCCWTAFESQVCSCALAKNFTSVLNPIQM